MASLLDISLLDNFSIVFVILFIFTAVYAALTLKGTFGGNKGLNALIAFTVSMMFIFVPDAVDVIKSSIPWYVVMMVGMMMLLLVVNSFGGEFSEPLLKNLPTYILVIGILILIINVAQKVGQDVGPYLGNETLDPDNVPAGGEGDVGSGSFTQNFGATLFHPKVLAMMLVLIVALFAVLMIGYVPVA